MADGVQRTSIQDGDTIVMKGVCEIQGPAGFRVGFGECAGTVLPNPR